MNNLTDKIKMLDQIVMNCLIWLMSAIKHKDSSYSHTYTLPFTPWPSNCLRKMSNNFFSFLFLFSSAVAVVQTWTPGEEELKIPRTRRPPQNIMSTLPTSLKCFWSFKMKDCQWQVFTLIKTRWTLQKKKRHAEL